MNEAMSWRRGFAAGFVALALSIGGHLATADRDVSAEASCPLAQRRLADKLAERVTPQMQARELAQRVARLVLGAVLGTCS
jgi:predicted nucleic acid-binding protein